MGVASDDSSSNTGGFSFPKNLSVWWSEETEYVLQRIERWAAYARGYNRLRSVRLSPGRMTMQEEPDSRWNLGVARPEQAKLRCCALGNHDYKSNGNLERNCLEAYSLDHSIYFKTVGEIRSEIRPTNVAAVAGNGNALPRQSLPLDCGDFLASDFDETDDDAELEELDDADYELREQLQQLEAACTFGKGSCRAAVDEDEINNNAAGKCALAGFPRSFARPTAAAQ